MTENFREKLKKRQEETGSYLCVGLDPLPEKLPSSLKRKMWLSPGWKKIAQWMIDIVDVTAPYASMFKPQKAHYEAIPGGGEALQHIVDYIHIFYPNIPVFLDCKRGDIGRTQERYRIAQFDIDGVDGMNFSPYMGEDCMSSLVDKDHPERAIVGLCYTSNSSARQVQDVKLESGEYYWEFMARCILDWAEELGVLNNAGLVMAAAHEKPEGSDNVSSYHLESVRKIVVDKLLFLVPGVGTQGGFAEATMRAGYAGPGSIAVNSSSGIIFASQGRDYMEAAEKEAWSLYIQLYTAVKEYC